MKRAVRLAIAGALAGAALSACSGNVFELAAGSCFDGSPSGDEVSNVDVVECDGPHDNEVYATFDLEGEDFPGAEEVGTLANDGCESRFEDFVGIPYAESQYYISSLQPSEQSWEDGDDREVVCFLHTEDRSPMEGSAEDSAE